MFTHIDSWNRATSFGVLSIERLMKTREVLIRKWLIKDMCASVSGKLSVNEAPISTKTEMYNTEPCWCTSQISVHPQSIMQLESNQVFVCNVPCLLLLTQMWKKKHLISYNSIITMISFNSQQVQHCCDTGFGFKVWISAVRFPALILRAWTRRFTSHWTLLHSSWFYWLVPALWLKDDHQLLNRWWGIKTCCQIRWNDVVWLI